MVDQKGNENPLGVSWHNSPAIPMLSPATVMDYFSDTSNPFYDNTCNNEIVKMQRLNPEQLSQMTGIEYTLLHVQEPILYVVRKQHRLSPTQVTPLNDYYIIAGVVYQAPDLTAVLNSRIMSVVHNMKEAFDEASSYSRYHPSKGYWWEFPNQESGKDKAPPKKKVKKTKEEPSSTFQRQCLDMLLDEWTRRFPPRPILPGPGPQASTQTDSSKPGGLPSATTATSAPIPNAGSGLTSTAAGGMSSLPAVQLPQGGDDGKVEVKQEPSSPQAMPPPDKKFLSS